MSALMETESLETVGLTSTVMVAMLMMELLAQPVEVCMQPRLLAPCCCGASWPTCVAAVYITQSGGVGPEDERRLELKLLNEHQTGLHSYMQPEAADLYRTLQPSALRSRD